ncbi:hypothetical protein LTR40_007544 [Exophiala xenobiotica]|nr:hypothetical protein LTR40_007544 [Exophiala xenobiotica]
MEVLHEPPKASSFTPLAEHQSTTPASFYSGPPVLHYYSDRSKLLVLEHEVESISAFTPLLQRATSVTSQPHSNGAGEANGHDAADTQPQPQPPSTQKVLDDVDVWVTSDKLFLFSPTANAGLSIPYPSISLHAIQSLPVPQPSSGPGSSTNAPVQGQGVYMQLISSSEEQADDDELDSISLTIIPTASGPPQTQPGDDNVDPDADPIAAEDKPLQTPIMAMFTALSNCSNLHPDPVDPGDEEDQDDPSQSRLFQAGLAFPGASDGGLPPAMPGSGGWITAENMHEFVDEDGNWIENENEGDEPRAEDIAQDDRLSLGPGAGTVRSREEEGDGHADGEAGDGAEETKWQRTSLDIRPPYHGKAQ